MKHQFIFLLLLLVPYLIFAQSESKLDQQKSSEKPTYLEIGAGIGSTKMRDFATSPLFYQGPSVRTTIGRLAFDSLRESAIRFTYHGGGLSSGNGKDDSQSSFQSLSLSYGRLYHLNAISNSKWNVKVGGEVNVVGNLRGNHDLFNAALGTEVIANVFAVAQVGKDVSRKTAKQKKFLFVNYHLKPRKRYLSYALKTGVLNSSYRNSFSYIGDYALVNEDNPFKDYQFNFFSGFRIASSLDYTIYLENRNAIRISYVTDIYKTKGDVESLEVAQYALKIALLFNTK